ncbi:zinc-alpha-2-glycoprotein-like [Sphaeramia orbicularis]|uniref:Zinc-alpha-2-glycoprotein-like n=1 Tax=Sphaeramia orbicularis TaxID=375764 RepID=A0A672YME8_9TELE|nr:zinc-alpha-2-glycoprotein-like [Sphaeramia orbicularis]
MRRMRWFLCFLSSVAAYGPHSLIFLSTGRTAPKARPVFEQLTVYDDVGISYCDSKTTQEQVKPRLQSRHFSESCNGAFGDVLRFIKDISSHTNDTVDVVQRRRGCILSSSGRVSAFDTWAVNGVDFLTFDPESEQWTSHEPSALPIKKKWNEDKIRNYAFSGFISQDCPLIIGRITLRSIDKTTDLHVFAKPTADTDRALLRCHVTTTDRSASSMHLVGDGASRAFWISVTGPVPSGDGSVILRLTAMISLTQVINTYGCTVQTGGHNITVYWDGNTLDHRPLIHTRITSNSMFLGVLGFFCVVATVTLISCAMIYLQKCVKTRRPPPPPPPSPALVQQFHSFIQSSTLFPDIRDILISAVYATNTPQRYRHHQEEWYDMMRFRDQDYYDPEFFAGQV